MIVEFKYLEIAFSLLIALITNNYFHKLLKNKLRCNFYCSMSWHGNFTSFADNIFLLWLIGIKHKNPECKNEANYD